MLCVTEPGVPNILQDTTWPCHHRWSWVWFLQVGMIRLPYLCTHKNAFFTRKDTLHPTRITLCLGSGHYQWWPLGLFLLDVCEHMLGDNKSWNPWWSQSPCNWCSWVLEYVHSPPLMVGMFYIESSCSKDKMGSTVTLVMLFRDRGVLGGCVVVHCTCPLEQPLCTARCTCCSWLSMLTCMVVNVF